VSREGIVRERIRRLGTRAGLGLDDSLVEALTAYVALLRRWNERMNLTALDDRDRGLERLIIEPVAAVAAAGVSEGRLLDVGSGGGSPAIPMKLAMPRLAVRMVEARAKKAAFLREACRALSLDDVAVETARYEALLSRPELHEAHDLVTVRAVRMDEAALRSLQAFVRSGGRILLFRGSREKEGAPLVQPPLTVREEHLLPGHARLVVLEKLAIGVREDRTNHGSDEDA